MPSVKYALSAVRDLQRLREFLHSKNPLVAKRASETIRKSIKLLEQQPHMGRTIADMPVEYREWLINFGDGGYIARYRVIHDVVIVLAVRHQKEGEVF